MEPILTTAAITVGSIVATKALEKTGEKIGEVLWAKMNNFIEKLKKYSPQTVIALEQAPEQLLNYEQVILEIEVAAQANSEVNQAMEELVIAAKADANPKIVEILAMPNLGKLADKIGQVVMTGGTGHIDSMTL